MPLQFIYFADPMCSWCWGFSPVISSLIEKYGDRIPILIITGGLYAGIENPLTGDTKRTIRNHWEHVHEASGQPFDYTFFDKEGFCYNTEPACRAVVTARRLRSDLAPAYLAVLHEAFYARNRDITDREIIFDLAEEFGFDRNIYKKEFDKRETDIETQGDFALVRITGINGFPALLLSKKEVIRTISLGYQPWERIERAIDQLME